MSAVGTEKIITVPEATDLFSRAVIVGALQLLETAAAHGVAVQANTSTTAYTTAFPFQEYYDGMKLLFMPLYANTGASTINVNGKGVKKLCVSSGMQITNAGLIKARNPYWMEYDSTLDGGAGAFKLYSLYVDLISDQSIAGTKTFTDPIVCLDANHPIYGDNFKVTPEGGFAVKMVNKSGAASVTGLHVVASTAADNACAICAASVFYAGIGFMYDNGIADGANIWVVVDGYAVVQMASAKAAVRGQYCLLSSEDGKCESKAAVGDNDAVLGQFTTSCAAGGTAKIVIMPSRQ